MFLAAHLGLTLAGGALARRWWALPWWALAVGAILPDLVDKPVGLAMGNGYGRLVAHTAAFAAVLVLAAAFARRPWLVALAFGVVAHLALDRLWEVPSVLLWPLAGPLPEETWTAARYMEHAATTRYVLLTEALGGAALALVALWAWKKRREPSRLPAAEPARVHVARAVPARIEPVPHARDVVVARVAGAVGADLARLGPGREPDERRAEQ